jgi:hypothetical protein
MVTPASEYRLQIRVLIALSVLGILAALPFSQTAALFSPRTEFAGQAQVPPEAPATTPGEDGTGVGTGRGGPYDPVLRPRGNRTRNPGRPESTGGVTPLVAGNAGETPQSPIADDLATPTELAAADPLDGPVTRGGGSPVGGNAPVFGGGTGGAPGAVSDTPDPQPTPNPQPTPDPQPTGGPTPAPSPTPGGPGTGDPTTPVGPPTTAVPEPAAWLILIIGVAIVGGALRRRSAFARAELATAG